MKTKNKPHAKSWYACKSCFSKVITNALWVTHQRLTVLLHASDLAFSFCFLLPIRIAVNWRLSNNIDFHT